MPKGCDDDDDDAVAVASPLVEYASAAAGDPGGASAVDAAFDTPHPMAALRCTACLFSPAPNDNPSSRPLPPPSEHPRGLFYTMMPRDARITVLFLFGAWAAFPPIRPLSRFYTPSMKPFIRSKTPSSPLTRSSRSARTRWKRFFFVVAIPYVHDGALQQ